MTAPALLAGPARALTASVGALGSAVTRPRLPPDWTGAAADAARGRSARLLDRGAGLLDRARRVSAVLADVATRPFDEAADVRLAAALERAGRTGPAAAGPAADVSGPAAVAHWWAGLTADERDRLVAGRPELVGALDGVPAADRDRANRARLATARRVTEAEVAGLERRRDVVAGFGDLQEVEARLAAVRGRLTRILAIDTALVGDRALLAVDPASGRAAVAAGDVDRAAHVGVFVPGFTARAEDLPGRMRELEALTRPDTAVVAWYDYPAPQWSEVTDPARSVLTPRVAEDASARLRSFLTGLTAGHVTAIGHSYGSVTVARGVLGAPTVDDVVLLGSPGVTPLPKQPTWVAEARGDPVADAGWFGPDPNRVPGHRVLATDGSWGHRGYLEPGSTSAAGVAAVVQGRPQDAALDPSVGVGDRLRRLLEP